MFDQILVPVDRSVLAEYILPHTIAMAQACQSKVVLISILDPTAGSIPGSPVDSWDWQIQLSEAEAYLKDLASCLHENGLVAQTILLEGKAPDHVIRHSDSMGTNLIMLSSHGQGGASGWNVSSVAMKIIQQARTSVMIVRSNPSPVENLKNHRYRRILAPVDGSQRAEYGLSRAVHLANAQGAELLVVHVIKPPELPRRVPLSAQDLNLVKQVVESNRAEASVYLNKLKGSMDCQVETCLLIDENVTDALHALVERERIDLVVLNAHGLSGNPNWPYGNVAVHFLSYSTVPLLIVQDFARNHLVQSRAGINADEHWDQQRPILELSRQRLGETSR